MTLKNCPYCDKRISEKALICPNCGRKVLIENEKEIISQLEQSIHNKKIDFIKSYAEDKKRGWEIVSSIKKATTARLIWFVAISGYVIVHLKEYSKAITGQSFQGWSFLLLLIPWILTAICAIISEWFLAKRTDRESLYHAASIAEINVFRISKVEKAGQEDFKKLIEGNEKTKELEQGVKNIAKWFNRLESLTFIMLIFSFLWILIGPFCIMLLWK